jgi:transcriptional regulator with XRE-family HTH domain
MIFRLPTEVKDIGPSLKELRIRLGVKQQDIVDAGVGTQSTISALENGHKMPLFSTVLDYLAFLGCALDVTRTNGEDIPEARGTKRNTPREKVYAPRPYKYRARKSRAKPPPPRDPRQSPGITGTGRCLGCFTNHTEEQGEMCS